MQKVILSKNAIVGLASFVLNNYGHISETIQQGIELTKKTYSNSKLTLVAVYDLFNETAKAMQSIENEGALKGLEKKLAVFNFIEKEYVETRAEIKAIWAGWKTTVSWFIDQLITLLNSGRTVLNTFAG
ncbi:hypothetical protein B9T25_06325 [Acinetobacter sp. ANC 4470]|uniref:hypothetical protein n=1 Tax=Acinetobacter sp. ANC 4470 TaxID=1977881 RepID=UPI000A340F8E|nr:hypothetical protein [Acinetobacter sp. ANC 4470]OTG68294.1 hypothetical protein B9T25_06325 [Acinetobacter sp. ANC 4470]